MEYVYAALILHEAGEEINEDNLTDVLESAGVDVEESRVKALVAALEDVDIEEAIEDAAVPAGGAAAGGAGGGAEPEGEAESEEDAEESADEAEAEAEDDEDDEDVSGEGLGDLFG